MGRVESLPLVKGDAPDDAPFREYDRNIIAASDNGSEEVMKNGDIPLQSRWYRGKTPLNAVECFFFYLEKDR
ncbi:MAG TPA: hypothetical protein H9946_07040 [Candidatus Jeotgalibaca pullicola]|nr:hypothetical protein [Candidatus Jeotgalibaca pullicola]